MENYDNYTSSERRQLSATWQLEYECDWIEPTDRVTFEEFVRQHIRKKMKEKHLVPKEWFELE